MLSTALDRHVCIPIDFYRMLNAESHFLGDRIRRCYEARSLKPHQSEYNDDALITQRQVLQAACEILTNPNSKREYDELNTILTDVP